MANPPSTAALVQVLQAGLEQLGVEVITIAMVDDAVRMRYGACPVVWLDPRAHDEDLCRGLLDVLRVIAEGPEAATSAHVVRHLRSVV